jgi:hypothetical protein
MLLMALVSIPLYICAATATPSQPACCWRVCLRARYSCLFLPVRSPARQRLPSSGGSSATSDWLGDEPARFRDNFNGLLKPEHEDWDCRNAD